MNNIFHSLLLLSTIPRSILFIQIVWPHIFRIINLSDVAVTQTNGATYPGRVRVSFGGVGRNVADALSRLRCTPLFVSAIGVDLYAKMFTTEHAYMVRTRNHYFTVLGCPAILVSYFVQVCFAHSLKFPSHSYFVCVFTPQILPQTSQSTNMRTLRILSWVTKHLNFAVICAKLKTLQRYRTSQTSNRHNF